MSPPLSSHPDAATSIEFIRSMTDAAGTDTAVLGLSGGIDSTVVAYLAVDALGADNVHGYVLPSDVNIDENMSDAEWVADHLGITYDIVSIDPLVDAFADLFPDFLDDELASANLQARLRAAILYLHANADGGLVLGTGNRAETYTGYFTKYGDGAVDCHPIGHLYKTEVWELARDLGVPDRYIEKPPTAGLWADQTDEAELGLSYEQIDAALYQMLDEDRWTPEAIAAHADGVSEDHAARVLDLVAASEHKRVMPPAPDRD